MGKGRGLGRRLSDFRSPWDKPTKLTLKPELRPPAVALEGLGLFSAGRGRSGELTTGSSKFPRQGRPQPGFSRGAAEHGRAVLLLLLIRRGESEQAPEAGDRAAAAPRQAAFQQGAEAAAVG